MKPSADLIRRIEVIEQRNQRVEIDKRWERSWTRRSAIALLTYVVVVVYLHAVSNDNPWVNALVPPVGFLLSTLAMSWLRQLWQQHIKR